MRRRKRLRQETGVSLCVAERLQHTYVRTIYTYPSHTRRLALSRKARVFVCSHSHTTAMPNASIFVIHNYTQFLQDEHTHTNMHHIIHLYLRRYFDRCIYTCWSRSATRTHKETPVSVPPLARLLIGHHALIHSTYVLRCLDERTACIYIFSSDVCAFS